MATLPQSLGSEIDDAPETGNRAVETLAAKVRPVDDLALLLKRQTARGLIAIKERARVAQAKIPERHTSWIGLPAEEI